MGCQHVHSWFLSAVCVDGGYECVLGVRVNGVSACPLMGSLGGVC